VFWRRVDLLDDLQHQRSAVERCLEDGFSPPAPVARNGISPIRTLQPKVLASCKRQVDPGGSPCYRVQEKFGRRFLGQRLSHRNRSLRKIRTLKWTAPIDKKLLGIPPEGWKRKPGFPSRTPAIQGDLEAIRPAGDRFLFNRRRRILRVGSRTNHRKSFHPRFAGLQIVRQDKDRSLANVFQPSIRIHRQLDRQLRSRRRIQVLETAPARHHLLRHHALLS